MHLGKEGRKRGGMRKEATIPKLKSEINRCRYFVTFAKASAESWQFYPQHQAQ